MNTGKHRNNHHLINRPKFYHQDHSAGNVNYTRSGANSELLNTSYSHGIRATYDNDHHTPRSGSIYHDYDGRSGAYDTTCGRSTYESSGPRAYDSGRSSYDYHLLAHRDGSRGGSDYGSQLLWGATKSLDHNRDRGERGSNVQHDKSDETAWLKEITRCTHFERDHYCKELTNCRFFHEGIDCIRFFTRRPCLGAKCKFKHRINLAEILERDTDTKGKKSPEYKGRDAQKEEVEKHRDSDSDNHKDKNKKRAHKDTVEIKGNAEVHEHSKRTKRMDDNTSTQTPQNKTLHNKQEKEDGRRVLRRPSGGIEVILPPNWRAAWSKQGEPYYYNTATGERTWDMPVEKPTTGDGRKEGAGTKEKRDSEPIRNKHERRRADTEERRGEGKQCKERIEIEKSVSVQGAIGMPNTTHQFPTKHSAQERSASKTKEHVHKEKHSGEEEKAHSREKVTLKCNGEDGGHQVERKDSNTRCQDVERSSLDDGGEQPKKPHARQLCPDASRILSGSLILTHLLHPALSELVVKFQQPSPSTHIKKSSPAPLNPSNNVEKTILTCLQCTTLPTISKFTLVNPCDCCLHCDTVMKLKTPAKKTQSRVEPINNTHNTLVDLYKKLPLTLYS